MIINVPSSCMSAVGICNKPVPQLANCACAADMLARAKTMTNNGFTIVLNVFKLSLFKKESDCMEIALLMLPICYNTIESN